MRGLTLASALLVLSSQFVVDHNVLESSIGVDWAAESPLLHQVTLSNKSVIRHTAASWIRAIDVHAHLFFALCVRFSRLQGPLPSFCGSPLVNLAAFDSNVIDSFPDLSCYGSLQQLQLQSNPIRGQLPPDLWERLPVVIVLDLSNTLLNGSDHMPRTALALFSRPWL